MTLTDNGVIEIFTDGACSGNPGPGGWAALLRFGKHEKMISGGELLTTNNRMELKAAIEGLNTIKKSAKIHLITDSIYLKDGVTIWLAKWQAKNWRNASGKIVKNQELWQELDLAVKRHKHITWEWTKAHAGHKENETVDAAARLEITKLKLVKG